MSPVRLIACDLDGTLLDADHCTIPAVNVAALLSAMPPSPVTTQRY